MPATETRPPLETRPVWDRVTRIWHWLLAASVVAGWLLGEFRTFSTMQWHMYAGYCIGALLLFRVGWGWRGPPAVRFTTLWPRPAVLARYLGEFFRRRPSGVAGHSPLGALATLLMLLILLLQFASGLFSESDALFFSGPLAGTVPPEVVREVTGFHHVFSRVVLAAVGLHLAVMVFYRVWKHEDLVGPMLTGKKQVRQDAPDPEPESQ